MKVISLLACLMIVAFSSVALPDDAKNPQAVPNELPRDWSLEEIVKGWGGGKGKNYVLAWYRKKSDDGDFRVDACLTISVNENGKGYSMTHLYRHPNDKKPEWNLSMIHILDQRFGPVGIDYWHLKNFDGKPSNKQIYGAMSLEDLNWSFTFEKRWKIVGCGVCEKSWLEAVGEKPTEFFGLANGSKDALSREISPIPHAVKP